MFVRSPNEPAAWQKMYYLQTECVLLNLLKISATVITNYAILLLKIKRLFVCFVVISNN